jgi:prefoldin subunit 5
MNFLRNMLLLGLGYLAVKTLKRAIENVEAQRVKVKAKAEEATAKMPRLKLDPITGVYTPEA